METAFSLAPSSWLFAAQATFIVVQLLGIACFCYIVKKRLAPMLAGERDFRFDRPWQRTQTLFKYWLAQWKHPRYPGAGFLHILIFAGFITLALRSFSLLVIGMPAAFGSGSAPDPLLRWYALTTDYAATVVFACMIVAVIRRIVFRPARYAVPERYGKGHPADAIFLLGLIALLMFCDSLFAASEPAVTAGARMQHEAVAIFSLAWLLKLAIGSTSAASLWSIHTGASLFHTSTFYFLLCYRPFGIQFHVETSLFNVYFAKLDRGAVKPVRWGVDDGQIDQVKTFGVKEFKDFTWKHILDFYSCADCGRCSDKCPANAAGRPLSPRFLSIKARDYAFRHFPVFGKANNSHALIGSIYSEDEIWSCTTCGQCEEECPLLIEYIDKIVDLRRGMIDDGNVPQTLQKPLKALESRGNPYGKLEKKRADWAKNKDFAETCKVRILDGDTADTLFFVDSITSYDDRIQSVARATAHILDAAGKGFGILGPAEKDSGHEVRRFGEELLFMSLRDQNIEAIRESGARHIVTADPHALNALKHDYKGLPPVEHISQLIAREVKTGKLRLMEVEDTSKVYTYHDPCYLGRHNQIYEGPRDVLDAIPGLKRVEMARCRDRSFCCGGGGLMLFYEPKENERMGVLRVRMAAEAGANVIVTACPFCMVNIEDAIKVTGMEGQMMAIDLAELVDQQLVRTPRLEEVPAAAGVAELVQVQK
jgi:Fe-S oxidoreductase